jgi:hypothetical protein
MDATPSLSNPKAVAQAGEKIYSEKYKEEYETKYFGKFVAINIKTQTPTLGDSAEESLENAKRAEPDGVFHLMRFGFAGAFQVSYSYSYQNADNDWVFR